MNNLQTFNEFLLEKKTPADPDKIFDWLRDWFEKVDKDGIQNREILKIFKLPLWLNTAGGKKKLESIWKEFSTEFAYKKGSRWYSINVDV